MRTKAHQIQHDSEALREDIFKHRKALQEKKELNEKLKKKHEDLERENLEYETFIQNNPYFWNTSDKNESKLLSSLKKQERQLQDKLRQKQLEHDDAIKSVKYTRLREMDIEIEELEEESRRLGSKLTETMQRPEANEIALSEAEQKYYKKKNLINFLRKDNEDMESNLKILTDQNRAYRAELDRQEQEIADCDDVLNTLRKDIRKKDEQIQMLRREDADPQVRESEKSIKAELDKVRMDRRQIEADIRVREDEIAQLRQRIADEKKAHEEMLEKDKREKAQLKKEIEEVKKKLNRGYEKHERLSEESVSDEESKSADHNQPAVKKSDQFQEDLDEVRRNKEIEESKLRAEEANREEANRKEQERVEEEARQARLREQEEAKVRQLKEAMRKVESNAELQNRELEDAKRKQEQENDARKKQEQEDAMKRRVEEIARAEAEAKAMEDAQKKAKEETENRAKFQEQERRDAEEKKKKDLENSIEKERVKKEVGKELRYTVRAAKIEPSTLESTLIDKRDMAGKVPLSYVKMKLENDPFTIQDERKVLAVLDHIRDENGPESQGYTSQEIAQSVKDLIGPYRVTSETEDKITIAAISKKYFSGNREELQEAFNRELGGPEMSPMCSEKELRTAFSKHNIVMQNEDHEFVVLQLFKQSGRLDFLPYRKIFEIFAPQNANQSGNQTNSRVQELEDYDEDLLDEY